MSTRRDSTQAETLARLANGRTLILAAGLASFGFLFLGSAYPRHFEVAEHAGSADPADYAAAEVPGIGSTGPLEAEMEAAPPDEGLFYTVYRVVKGDTVSAIAESHGVTVDSIVTFNGITNTRALSIGKYLKIPSMNGILHVGKAGDSALSLAEAFKISPERIAEVNGLAALDAPLGASRPVFLPDARLSSIALREINGDLFTWPVRGYITSWYGWRADPFSGDRSFHTGLDIGAGMGVPVRAAMEGKVSATGYSAVSGNYIVIAHHSGYSTMYGHLSRIAVKAGAWVTQSTVIGYVGNSGYSTGAHLHFTVSKWGKTLNPMTVLR